MHRSHMPKAERELRSRLAKLVHEQPLLRGTLTIRKASLTRCSFPGICTSRCVAGRRITAASWSW